MKSNKKFLLCVLLFVTATIKAEQAFTMQGIQGTISDLKREWCGASLVPAQDPRVIALIAAGVLTTCFGGLLVSAAFSDNKEGKPANILKKALAFIMGDLFVIGGIMEILFSRVIITSIDEVSHEALKEWNNNKR